MPTGSRLTDQQLDQLATWASNDQFKRTGRRVQPSLIRAVIQQESGGNPSAGSPAGAQGLMQLMPGTARGLGVQDIYNPRQNVMGGTEYLADQLQAHKNNVALALASYNAGPGAVAKYGGVPPYKETQSYVKNVMTLEQGYRNLTMAGPNAPAPLQSGVGAPSAPGGFGVPPAGVPPSLAEAPRLRRALDFAAPTPGGVSILSRLGGTAARAAQSAQESIPLPKIEATAIQPGVLGPKAIPFINTNPQNPVSEEGKGLIAEAQKWLGTPYSWGGGGPGGPSKGIGRGAGTVGFDCSGFLEYLYAKEGKGIGGTTYQQLKTGKQINPSQMRPGDAVFFSGGEHVGMYIGNGKFIHAPHTGDVVKISDLKGYYRDHLYQVRRY